MDLVNVSVKAKRTHNPAHISRNLTQNFSGYQRFLAEGFRNPFIDYDTHIIPRFHLRFCYGIILPFSKNVNI